MRSCERYMRGLRFQPHEDREAAPTGFLKLRQNPDNVLGLKRTRLSKPRPDALRVREHASSGRLGRQAYPANLTKNSYILQILFFAYVRIQTI